MPQEPTLTDPQRWYAAIRGIEEPIVRALYDHVLTLASSLSARPTVAEVSLHADAFDALSAAIAQARTKSSEPQFFPVSTNRLVLALWVLRVANFLALRDFRA